MDISCFEVNFDHLTQVYGFIHADDIKAMKAALDYYDICYDFDKLIADLPL